MKMLVKLLGILKPHAGFALLGLLLMILFSASDYIMPLFLRRIIDEGIAKSNLAVVTTTALTMGAIAVIRSVLAYFQGFFTERVGQEVAYDLRNKLYSHLQRLSFSFFDKQQTGQIMSRMTGDVDCIKGFLGMGVVNLLMCFFNFTATIAMFLWIEWKLGLLVLLPIPVLALVIVLFGKNINPAWERVREQMGKLTAVLQESISGIRAVKAFAREAYEKNKFNRGNLDNLNENMKRAGIEANAFPAMNILGGISFLLLIWFGSYFVISGEITIGTFMALQWYIMGLIWPIHFSGWLVNVMQQALAAAPRVFEILETQPEVDDHAHASDMPEGNGHVVFENVNYNFSDGQPALKNIHFEVKPGESVAIIGGTGSGKSTLIGLIPRFFDPSKGRILIDGRDSREIRLESLRSRIGMVMQETFLFSDTLRENIIYGSPGATQEEMENASKVACIHDFIQSLEEGYNAKVGERGIGLSGGQRQRIAIARAILMNPRILILDEATSSVDTATERAIQSALKEIMKGRTTFVIAQRLSTIKNVNRIIVLENGEIVETGTHEELIGRGGYYSRIYELQFKSQEILEIA